MEFELLVKLTSEECDQHYALWMNKLPRLRQPPFNPPTYEIQQDQATFGNKVEPRARVDALETEQTKKPAGNLRQRPEENALLKSLGINALNKQTSLEFC